MSRCGEGAAVSMPPGVCHKAYAMPGICQRGSYCPRLHGTLIFGLVPRLRVTHPNTKGNRHHIPGVPQAGKQ